MALTCCGLCAFANVPQSTIDKYKAPVADWPAFQVDDSVKAIELGPRVDLAEVDWQTDESVELGRHLFFDPRLSGSNQLACASCHDPNLGWTDGRRISFGHDRQRGSRNAMTLLNVAYFDELFWDGRADGLLDLITQPIQSPIEMNVGIEAVIARLENVSTYAHMFERAFGTDEITPERISIAMASFIRTIVSSRSRFDRFAAGEHDALADFEIAGLHLFRTKARCMNCHHGPMFSDGQFHHTGLSYFTRRFEDLGRFNVTGDSADRGRFRTPTLRDVKFTGPWMHNGLFTNFRGILRMYNHGITINSRVQKRPNAPPLSPLIRPLDMDKKEIALLEAFLESLGRIPRFIEAPIRLDAVTLQSETDSNIDHNSSNSTY